MRVTFRRAFFHSFAILLMASGFARDANATWKNIFSNPQSGGYRFSSGFFLDEYTGFIAADGRQGVFKTVDGGLTWIQVPLTPVPVALLPKIPLPIQDIRMTSRTHGWLAVEDAIGPAVYETTDGGNSWNGTSYRGDCVGIYQTSVALVVTNRGVGAGGAISTDAGKSFTHLQILDSTNGIAFVDDQHGIVSGFFDTLWSRTTDGGLTWQKIYSSYHPEAWGIYGVSGTGTYYAAGENNWIGSTLTPMSSANRSTDYGATWSSSTLPIRTTGHIAGVADTALYVQAATDDDNLATGPRSMYRSTNHGRTWLSVGGPARRTDTRFIVLGCRGEVVIAFDDQGGVWKTTDGGDGAFAQSSLSSSSTMLVDSINFCSPRDTVITIENLGCDDTIFITNAIVPNMPRLDVLDPSGGPPQYPYAIPPHQKGTLRLRLYSGAAGIYQTQVTVELRRVGELSYDVVHIISAMRFTNPVAASAKSLRFDSTALCDMRDTSVTLSNDSCFSVQILNSSIKYGTNFSLVTVINNDSIPSGGKKTFTVRFDPTQLGTDRDSLIVNLIILGQPARLAYPLTGIGVPDNPKFIMLLGYSRTPDTAIDFGTKTTCGKDTIIPFLITNPGCTFLNVRLSFLDSTKTRPPPAKMFDTIVFGGGGLHRIHSTPTTSDTIIGGIRAWPTQRGTFRGYLRVFDSIDGRTGQTTDVPFTITITDGPKVLALDDTHRDLDTIAFCDQKDVTIPFSNSNCDTIILNKLNVAGLGFSLINPPATPDTILPGKSGSVRVRFMPSASGLASGALKIGSDADSAKFRTIPFTAYVTPTDTVKLSAVVARLVVQPGDTSMISIVPQMTYHNKNVNSIDLTLEYNGDVMEPLGYPVPGPSPAVATSDPIVPSGGKLVQLPLHLRGPNLSLDSNQPILSQQFRFFISDSLKTDFRISHFDFNGGDYVFSKCTLGEVIDTGTITLNLVCGDSLLYRVMRYGGDYSIDNGIAPSPNVPRPNPVTSGEIDIPFRALRAAGVELTLVNAMGQEVLSDVAQVHEAGIASFTIRCAALASGVYHYIIRPLDGGRGIVSGEFVVMK